MPNQAYPAPPALQTYLKSEMQRLRIPGLQLAVVRHGEIIVSDCFGLASLEYGVPVSHETLFPLQSATKAFTGVALVQLLERGKLDLAASIGRYLEALPPAWQGVTIQQLAAHLSGLPDIVTLRGDIPCLIGDSGGPEAAWTKVQTLPVESAPGEQYRYNQTNYVLLGKLIDRLSGKPFAQFMQEQQFDRLGMMRTRFGDDRDIVPHCAGTYSSFGMTAEGGWGPTELYKPYTAMPAVLRTATGLLSTAEEIARWVIGLQQGRLFEAGSSFQTLVTPAKFNDGKTALWGIGWPVVQRSGRSVYAPGGGAKCQLLVYPQDDLAVIILTNLQGAFMEQAQIATGVVENLGFVEKVASYFLADSHDGMG